MNYVNTIKEFLSQDLTVIIIGVFVLMATVIALYEIIGKFSKVVGKPVKWMKKKDEDHELIIENAKSIKELSERHEEDTKQSIRHDKIIREDLHNLTSTVNEIAIRLNSMEDKFDATEMVKLKDRIVGYYRKYKDIGEWEKFEADTFFELYDRYVSHGGNSFVKHDIEPIMRELKIKK